VLASCKKESRKYHGVSLRDWHFSEPIN